MKSNRPHLRCQIEYEKGQENYIDTIVNVVDSIVTEESVESFYFFWQDHSEKFEKHVQLDLFVKQQANVEEVKDYTEKVLQDSDRRFYWEDEFISTWFGINEIEEYILLESRKNSAEVTLRTLKAYKNGELEHLPSQLVNRNYHVMANQHGMTYWDEIKFCAKRLIQIPLAKVMNLHEISDYIYNKLFLRKELENIDLS